MHFGSKALCSNAVTELMQEHANEKHYQESCRKKSRHQVPLGQGYQEDDGQEDKKTGVDLDVYTKGPE